MIFEHVFQDNTQLRVTEKEFPPAKMSVPTLEFRFRDEMGRDMVLGVPLWDKRCDLVKQLRDALTSVLGDDEQEIITLGREDMEIKQDPEKMNFFEKSIAKTKICTKCGDEYKPNSPNQKKCNSCRTRPKGNGKPVVETVKKAELVEVVKETENDS